MQHVAKPLGLGGLALLLLFGCGAGDSRAPAAAPLEDDGSPSQLHQTAIDPCLNPAAGCPCDEAGVTLDCGTVTEHRGDYVICYPGAQTCNEGVWGECLATTTTPSSVQPAGD